MINVIEIKNGLPISVIIPLQKSREAFFYQFVLPLLNSNNPAEIIINTNDGNAAKKRNEGFFVSTYKHVFFMDDDILLPKDHLKTLYNNLIMSDCGYAYTGYTGIVIYPETNAMKNNFDINTVEFDEELLKKVNYISTMSLINREVFPMFDETLPRFNDYDIYLNMLSKGIKGKAVHGTKFYAFYSDEGITSLNNDFSYAEIHKKYPNIIPVPLEEK